MAALGSAAAQPGRAGGGFGVALLGTRCLCVLQMFTPQSPGELCKTPRSQGSPQALPVQRCWCLPLLGGGPMPPLGASRSLSCLLHEHQINKCRNAHVFCA